jgi:hypothetical protein
MMTLPVFLGRKLQFFFYCFGLSSLGGAFFLHVLVFSIILFNAILWLLKKPVGFELGSWLNWVCGSLFRIYLSKANASSKISAY